MLAISDTFLFDLIVKRVLAMCTLEQFKEPHCVRNTDQMMKETSATRQEILVSMKLNNLKQDCKFWLELFTVSFG